MATVHAEDGELLLDQALPVTKAGLSGMTMIHHQTHTTTARARRCVECHRTAVTYGRGSVNFRLARDFVMTAGETGVRAVSIDRKNPADSSLIAAAGIADARALAIVPERNSGHARYVLAASPQEGLVTVSTEVPGFPRVGGRLDEAVTDPQRMVAADDTLYVADGEAGLRIFDVDRPGKPRQIAHVTDSAAHDVHLDGPTLFVAAGAEGVVALDVSKPSAPRTLLMGFDLNGSDTAVVEVRRLSVLFQYSRPHPEDLEGRRSKPRRLAALGTARRGVWLVDVTEPAQPIVLLQALQGSVQDLELATVYELGSEGGAIPTQERDLVIALNGGQLAILDVTDPTAVAAATVEGSLGVGAQRALRIARVYTPPFLTSFAVVAGPAGVRLVDITRPTTPTLAATVARTGLAYDVAVEEFPLDRTVDARGDPIMDISHEDARWLSQMELLRVLNIPVLDLDSIPDPPRRKEKRR
jgi:hypothetical protein